MSFQPQLPPETWTEIFKTLSETRHWFQENDIKSVRLTCRLFDQLATPFLMSEIFFAPLSFTLTKLTAVSHHPILSRSIKTVVYASTRYQAMGFLDYQRAVEESSGPRVSSDLETMFSQYVQHNQDQTMMERSGELTERLCSALTRLPNGERVIISPNIYCYLDNALSSDYLLDPESACDEAFLHVCRILSLTDTKIRELRVEDAQTEDQEFSGLTAEAFREMSLPDSSHCRNVFQGVRTLELSAEDEGGGGWIVGQLADLLSYATGLENLLINGCFYRPLRAEHFLSNTMWCCLTTLSLTHTIFRQGELLAFLRRHSITLKNLSHFDVEVRNGSWKAVLTEMKPSLSLQSIEVYDLHESKDDGYGEDVFVPVAAIQGDLLGDGYHPLLLGEQLRPE